MSLRPIYPMHWENNNCDPIDGANTKTCHCAEGKWVRGSGHGNLGSRIGSAYLNFYKVRKGCRISYTVYEPLFSRRIRSYQKI